MPTKARFDRHWLSCLDYYHEQWPLTKKNYANGIAYWVLKEDVRNQIQNLRTSNVGCAQICEVY